MDSTLAARNIGKEEKETVILRAALKAYAQYGMAEATTRQIADIAGIGKSTIYEYFQSKEALQSAAFQYLMSGMAESRREIRQLAERDPAMALGRYLDNAIRTAQEEPSALLLITQYSLSNLLKAGRFETVKEQYSHIMRDVMLDLKEEFRFIVQRGVEAKVFHLKAGVPPDGMVYTIGALIREIQAQAFLQDEEELKQTCSIIRETVLKLLGIEGF